MRAVLNVVRRPITLRFSVVVLVKQRVECLEHERFVRFSFCAQPIPEVAAGVSRAFKIEFVGAALDLVLSRCHRLGLRRYATAEAPWTALAAARMTSITTSGCESMATWLLAIS